MNFVRLGLKPRVYSGFAVLVVIALALACFAVWELSSIATQMQKFSAINDNTPCALEVSERIGVILRSNLRYTIDADEQATEDAEIAEWSAIELLKAVSAATISEGRRTIYNSLQLDAPSASIGSGRTDVDIADDGSWQEFMAANQQESSSETRTEDLMDAHDTHPSEPPGAPNSAGLRIGTS